MGPLLVTWTNGNSFTRSQASHICLRYHTGWRYVNKSNTLQSSIWYYQVCREWRNVLLIIARKNVRKAKWCQLHFWMKQISDCGCAGSISLTCEASLLFLNNCIIIIIWYRFFFSPRTFTVSALETKHWLWSRTQLPWTESNSILTR